MQSDWQVGERIENRWEIHKILGGPGKSGFGIVYVVFDHKLFVRLAAKTFQAEVFALNPGIEDRFILEARMWVNLDLHQNVVKALFLEYIHGKPFLFLEYVNGGDLSTWIGNPRLTKDLPQVLRFAIQFCDGMTHALSKGIKAHRDIKPQNCLVTEDNILKVTDFGLAKALDDTPLHAPYTANSVSSLGVHVTKTGRAAGTCTHMAPEQFVDAKHADVRADVYSFGVMLFQMVRGRLPFEGRSCEDFARLHAQAAPPPLKSGQSALDAIVGKCLAKVACERYAGFGQLRDDLAGIYERLTKRTAPNPAPGREWNSFGLLTKAENLHKLGRSDEAIACVDRVLSTNPREVMALSYKGELLARLGRSKEAMASFERALALDPQYAEAWINKGTALGDLGRHEEELGCYDRALALNPRYTEARIWALKGRALNDLGRAEEALSCLDRSLAIMPQDVFASYELAWSNKGIALARLGRHEEAVVCYDYALSLDARPAGTWSNKGIALAELGRHEEALACFERSLSLDPRRAEAWYSKGIALSDLGRHEEALTCYDRCLVISPHYANAWFNKGAVLVNKFKRAREAITCFEHAERLGHPNAAMALDWCRERLGG